jgi:hypothetical protein
MSENSDFIPFDEILSNCFSSSCLKNARSGKLSKNLYVAHLSWNVEGLPYGDQHIWLLYSPTSSSFISDTLQKIGDFLERNPGIIFADIEEITLFSLPEIVILSDGYISFNNVTRYLTNGNFGHIGWLVGQGRSIDADDNKIITLIHSVVSNLFLKYKELQNDAFLLNGMKKLVELRKIARKILSERSEND